MFSGLKALKPVSGVCEQQRGRPALASMQSDQGVCYSLNERIISGLATSTISFFYIFSVAEQAGLNLTLSKNPETGFLISRSIMSAYILIYLLKTSLATVVNMYLFFYIGKNFKLIYI